MRAVWPDDKPMSVRISATDWVDGGVTGDDAVAVARAFAAAGADIVHVSTGQTSIDAAPRYGRMYQTPFSDQIRNDAAVPTIAVGNITEADQVNAIIAAGRADLCALARPHLTDPYWTLHAAADLALITAAQKVEHYEICGYGTAKSYAEELGLDDVAKQLALTLQEEYDADLLMTQLAEERVNKEAESPSENTGTGSSKGRSTGRVKEKSARKEEMEMAPANSNRSRSSGRSNSGSSSAKGSRNNGESRKPSGSSRSESGARGNAPAKKAASSGRSSGSNGRSSSGGRGGSSTRGRR